MKDLEPSEKIGFTQLREAATIQQELDAGSLSHNNLTDYQKNLLDRSASHINATNRLASEDSTSEL